MWCGDTMGLVLCCPYWNQCMNPQNSFKGMGLLFITLLLLRSLLKHMSFQCIMTLKINYYPIYFTFFLNLLIIWMMCYVWLGWPNLLHKCNMLFFCGHKMYMLHMIYPRMGAWDIIRKEIWAHAIISMKQQWC